MYRILTSVCCLQKSGLFFHEPEVIRSEVVTEAPPIIVTKKVQIVEPHDPPRSAAEEERLLHQLLPTS